MTQSLINCSIFDSSTESYSFCTYSVTYPINYSKIKEQFPFEGQFHFRLQCNSSLLGIGLKPISDGKLKNNNSNSNNNGYIWLDLGPDIDDKIYASCSASGGHCVILRALVLDSLGTTPRTLEDTDYESYFQSARAYLDSARQEGKSNGDNSSTSSNDRKGGFGKALVLESDEVISASHGSSNNSSSSNNNNNNNSSSSNSSSSSSSSSKSSSFLGNLKSVVNTTVNTVKQVAKDNVNSSTVQNISHGLTSGAMSMWSNMKAATAQVANSLNMNTAASELTDQSEEILAFYSELLSTNYNDKNPQHLPILQDLWAVLFPGPSNKFQRDSMRWKDAGFQTTNPVSDLKNSGLLAVHSAIYLGKKYPQKMQQMLLNNRENIKTKYPFAIVIVNVTMLLADVLKLRDEKYLSSQFNCWEVFEERNSFFEIFSHCVSHVDTVWIQREAVRADFGGIVGEVKTLVASILSESPRSLDDFTQIAMNKGLYKDL